ncbi:hypothetical protein KFK09_026497 [Dendrobium nobile]|uniref:Uncharacterized protein n=1 Tax=Dendrobium nobile TaxID=94219 RepID=A0A8T3A7Y4_DENNO|nr:hypothetical protein KFK09_026497 [Dendrobium nobile]
MFKTECKEAVLLAADRTRLVLAKWWSLRNWKTGCLLKCADQRLLDDGREDLADCCRLLQIAERMAGRKEGRGDLARI